MSRVCGNGKRRRKMFRRLARKTAEALMPPLASRSRRNPPYGTTFDQNGPASLMRWMRLPFWRSGINTPSSFPISNPRSVGRKRRWFFRSFRPSGGKTSCSITAGRRRCIPARRRSRRGAGLFSGPANGQACSCEAQAQSRDYPVPPAPQSREGCLRRARRKRLRPQENRFFRPIHVDDPAEPL